MRWPWNRKIDSMPPPTSNVVGRGITHFDPKVPLSQTHGIHCNGIAVGYAIDGDAKMTVFTLTLNGNAVATTVMPNDAADMVAASILKGTTNGIVQ